MITKGEWDRTAQFAAAAATGEKHRAWYSFRRNAGRYALVTSIIGLGFGARWMVHHARAPHIGPAGLPVAFWVLLVLLILGTAWAFRPGRPFMTAAALIVRGFVIGLLWLGFTVYGVTVLI